MQARSTGTQRGTSLIETMIATAICATVMVAIAALVSTSARQSKNMGSTVGQATALAAQKVDQLMTMRFNAAPLVCASSSCGGLDYNSPVSGYVEYLDGTGVPVTGATSSDSLGVFFTRLWKINNSTSTTKLIEVIVFGKGVGTSFKPSVNMACIKAQQ